MITNSYRVSFESILCFSLLFACLIFFIIMMYPNSIPSNKIKTTSPNTQDTVTITVLCCSRKVSESSEIMLKISLSLTYFILYETTADLLKLAYYNKIIETSIEALWHVEYVNIGILYNIRIERDNNYYTLCRYMYTYMYTN